MTKRDKGTYGTIPNRVLTYCMQNQNATARVLLALANQSNYRDPHMTIGMIMHATNLKQRATETAVSNLIKSGFIAVSADGYIYQDAQDVSCGVSRDVSRGAHGRAFFEEENTVQDNKKETPEGQEGQEGQEKDTPLTPQGEKADEQKTVEVEKTPNTHASFDEKTGVESSEAIKKAAPSEKSSGGAQPVENSVDKPKRPKKRVSGADFDALALPLPDCIPADTWAEFVAHRREIRRPLTERAAKTTVQQLEKAYECGWDVVELIQDAIANGWTGCVFDKHKRQNPRPKTTHIIPFGDEMARMSKGDQKLMQNIQETLRALGE